MMNKVIVSIFFILVSFVAGSQNKAIHVVFNDQGDPVKAYDKSEDCVRFIDNKPFRSQDVRLQYNESDKYWQLETTESQMMNLADPVPLSDKQLASDSIYLIMQSSLQLVDKAFTQGRKIDCEEYAKNFNAKVIKIPFYYRDEKSVKAIMADRLKRGIK